MASFIAAGPFCFLHPGTFIKFRNHHTTNIKILIFFCSFTPGTYIKYRTHHTPNIEILSYFRSNKKRYWPTVTGLAGRPLRSPVHIRYRRCQLLPPDKGEQIDSTEDDYPDTVNEVPVHLNRLDSKVSLACEITTNCTKEAD